MGLGKVRFFPLLSFGQCHVLKLRCLLFKWFNEFGEFKALSFVVIIIVVIILLVTSALTAAYTMSFVSSANVMHNERLHVDLDQEIKPPEHRALEVRLQSLDLLVGPCHEV